ncbi:hypothetical protein MO767_18840 [Pseudomonas sp. UYIF39]|uniref:Rap1a/Tai family immunity protein n=1 Tax=Pseudomonas sp. UYIF39 TaxID=1630747 RepID=UPI00249E01B2|nr:Rap1a/Tai family immunity protein [Pseudomonas sp. UYIF39]MDI3356385.1 hypothetical protein [Pseudomonas sp. UYIF39]
MKAGIAVAVALTGAMASGQAIADGNKLLENCQQAVKAMDGGKDIEPMAVGQCFGMVEGVNNTMTILNSGLESKYRTCFPKGGISNGQAVRIVTKFLQENPALLDKPDAYLAMIAYKEAYPCK